MTKSGCTQDFLDQCEEIEIRYENKVHRLCTESEKQAIFVNLLRSRFGLDGIPKTLGGKTNESFKSQERKERREIA
jgi:hypothetical protein